MAGFFLVSIAFVFDDIVAPQVFFKRHLIFRRKMLLFVGDNHSRPQPMWQNHIQIHVHREPNCKGDWNKGQKGLGCQRIVSFIEANVEFRMFQNDIF